MSFTISPSFPNPFTVAVTASNFAGGAPGYVFDSPQATIIEDPFSDQLSYSVTETGIDQLTASNGEVWKVGFGVTVFSGSFTSPDFVDFQVTVPLTYFQLVQGQDDITYDIKITDMTDGSTADLIVKVDITGGGTIPPPTNTPPFANAYTATLGVPGNILPVSVSSVAGDHDGDGVKFVTANLLNGWQLISKLSVDHFFTQLLANRSIVFDATGAASVISDAIVPNGATLNILQPKPLDFTFEDVGAIFFINYSVADFHNPDNSPAALGQVASNVITVEAPGSSEVPSSASSGGLVLGSTVDAVEALFVGYLSTVPDLAGISSWVVNLVTSGLSLQAEAAAFASQPAVLAEYPFLANPQSATQTRIDGFINSVYHNLFDRAPSSTELASAESTLSANLGNAQVIDSFILNLMLGAQGPDLTTIQTKIGSAEDSLIVQNDNFAITRTTLTLDQAAAELSSMVAGTTTETQYINSLLSQVADTTTPVVAVEGSMYGAVGSSAVITSLVTNFLPGQIAYAIQVGLDPEVFACLETALVFAFANESGNTAFAIDYGPSNSSMPATAAGDAAFAAAATNAIFGSAQTAYTATALLGYVHFLEGFFTANGIVGVQNPSADQIVIAARAGAWGEGVAIALENNLGSLPGQTTNFLEDAAQGTAIYSTSLSSQPAHAPFQGGASASVVITASSVQVTGVAAPIDHIVM